MCKVSNSAIDVDNIAPMFSPPTGAFHSVMFSENHDVSSNQHAGRIPFRVDPTGQDKFWGCVEAPEQRAAARPPAAPAG